ncbi:hypothetical protein ACR9PU_14765, partial [Piscirickettsia salmonis]
LIDQGQDIAEENLRVVQGFLGQLDFLKKKDGGGESILTAALSSGNQQIVTEIIENICRLMPNANLVRGLFSGENKAKKELLVAKAGNGAPGLYLALKNGHHRAIAAYIDGLVKANLSGSDLSHSLRA